MTSPNMNDDDFLTYEECIEALQQRAPSASSNEFGDEFHNVVDVCIASKGPEQSPTYEQIHAKIGELPPLDSNISCPANSNDSKFDKSPAAKKMKNRRKKVKRRAPKPIPDELRWKHNKISGSVSYLKIVDCKTTELTLAVEVFQTKRKFIPLKEDKNDIKKVDCDLVYTITGLDPSKTNYVSLKGLLNKKAIYGSRSNEVSKIYTWVRIQGSQEYLFLYCQTGKIEEVHNMISIKNGVTSTRSINLNSFSKKLSKQAVVNSTIGQNMPTI